jgi:hypothetical protein
MIFGIETPPAAALDGARAHPVRHAPGGGSVETHDELSRIR